MKIGYARVSTLSQNLDRQIAALRAEGCDVIFREKASGRSTKGRPQLEKAIDALGTADIFVIAEWDRATRSMMDGIRIMQRIADRGASIKVLDRDFLDLTTPIGQGFLMFLSGLAEDERRRITKRAREGRQAAVKRGAKFGPKFKLTTHQQGRVRERAAAGETQAAIAADFNVSEATISRIVNGGA